MTATAVNLPNGVFAAIPTPTGDNGQIDYSTLERLVRFVLNAGIQGVCIGGATGEYPHFETSERKAIVRHVASIVPDDRALLVGIGGPSIHQVVELGRTAMESGSRALLLPMPMFFRYAQEDLRAYCEQVSRTLAAPCLLYDLPDFTNGLSPKTVLGLLSGEKFVVGIKDSSGRAERLAAFASPAGRNQWTLLVGDDRLLHRGLLQGWNGGISGVAALCPELSVRLWRAFEQGRADESARLQQSIDELIVRLAVFPTPWGIRAGLAARGFDTGPLPLPMTPERQRQIRDFQAWLTAWLPAAIGPG
jgi:dihydrodipicolinate synthase/N-acetylneuraminate lyase